jgi:hypothetical protein
VPTPAPAKLAISGTVISYAGNKPVPNASIKLYSSSSFATPFSTTLSAADGTYSIDVPAGTPDLVWSELTAADYIDQYPHAYRFDFSQGDLTDVTLRAVVADNIESAALLVKEIWDPAAMVVIGYVHDCDRLVVMHAAVALSTTSKTRTFAPRASIYYGAPGAVPLAVPPEDRGDTNDNGAYAAFHVPIGQPLYVQAWGFVDAAAQAMGEAGLTLIAEQPVRTVAGSAANVQLWAQ